MLVAELFFGRDIPGRAPLNETEWRAFAADTVTPNFPDGFTSFDAEGQWRNPATGAVTASRQRRRSSPRRAPPPRARASPPRSNGYYQRAAGFRQQSVGIITT